MAEDPDLSAPDGSEVRLLLSASGGSMAHFRLPAGQVSRAVRHRSVEELWYVVGGQGEIWRGHAGREAVAALEPGICLHIQPGTAFQFRADASGPLSVLAVTMPPWPGEGEAEFIAGTWAPTV